MTITPAMKIASPFAVQPIQSSRATAIDTKRENHSPIASDDNANTAVMNALTNPNGAGRSGGAVGCAVGSSGVAEPVAGSPSPPGLFSALMYWVAVTRRQPRPLAWRRRTGAPADHRH